MLCVCVFLAIGAVAVHLALVWAPVVPSLHSPTCPTAVDVRTAGQAFTKDNARLSDELEQAIRAAEELRDACTAAEGDAERVRQAHEREVKPKLAAAQALLARLTSEREELGKLGNLSSTVSETQMRINMREKYLLGQLDDMRKEMAEQQRRLRTNRAPTATEVHALKEELEFLRFSASQPSEHALRVSLLKTMNAAAVKQEKLQQYAAQLQAERVTSEDAVIATIAERNLLKQVRTPRAVWVVPSYVWQCLIPATRVPAAPRCC